MPALDRWSVIQLALLLLAVPAQYFVTKYANNESQRNVALKGILSQAVNMKNKYLRWSEWQKWCLDFFYKSAEQSDDMGESPAVEVLKFRDPEGYFAGSPEPRTPREPHIKFRVGQVIVHKKWGYRGVIIGWDPVAKAPEEWLKQMHPPDKPHWREKPNYSVLVDIRDRPHPQTTYVVEENIEVVSNTKIIHPELDDYFESWDGAQYIPRPSLKKLYPHD